MALKSREKIPVTQSIKANNIYAFQKCTGWGGGVGEEGCISPQLCLKPCSLGSSVCIFIRSNYFLVRKTQKAKSRNPSICPLFLTSFGLFAAESEP